MIMRHDDGNYDFPGGQLEWGEEMFESLQRELQEELDFKLNHHPRLFSVWNFVMETKDRHSVIINYIYEMEEIIDIKSPEGMEVLWLTKNEMLNVVKDVEHVSRMFDWDNNQNDHLMFYCN